jgi:hypothetical protein
MAASKGEQAMTDLEINEAFGKPMYEADPTNARYNSLQLQCYEQRKEINRLMDRINRLAQAGDCLLSHRNSTDYHEKVREWDKAKKDKP